MSPALTAPGSYYLTGDPEIRHRISETSRAAVARSKGIFYFTVCGRSFWASLMVPAPAENPTCLECLAAD